jgi:hypothetical protein
MNFSNYPQQNFNQYPPYKGNAIPQNNPAPPDLNLKKEGSSGSGPFTVQNIKDDPQVIPPQNEYKPPLKDTIAEINKVFGQIRNQNGRVLFFVNIIYYNEAQTEEQKKSDIEIC